MFFIYFILGCIVLGLINAFVIYPIIEKESVKKKLKELENLILGILLIYIFIATFMFTTEMLTKYLHVNSAIIAIILVSLLFVWYYKKYNEITDKK